MNEYENSLNRIKRNVIPGNWTECDVAHYKTIEKALEKIADKGGAK